MPGAFGDQRDDNGPRLNCDIRRFLAHVAAGLAAVLLAVSLPASTAVADGDDEKETGTLDDDSLVGGGGEDEGGPQVTGPQEQSVLTIEGLIYRRKDLEKVPFTARGDAPPAATTFVPFDSSELTGEDYTAGLRGTLQGTIFDQPFEFSAFYVNPIGVEQTKLNLGGAGGVNTDTAYDNHPAGDIVSANSDNIFGMTVRHETKLFGGEASLVRPLGIPGLVIGARGIFFGEQLSSTAMDQADDVPGLGTDNQRDHVSIRTDNFLFGMQVGLQHMFEVGDFMRIGGSIKGGLYNNFVDRERTYVSENVTNLRSFETSDSANVFAQSLEINPRLEFKLSDGVLLTAAGSFLWLNNVSTALPHYASVEDLNGNRNVGAKDDVYFYGGSLGLTFMLDPPSASKGALTPIVPDTSPASYTDLEDRIADLEETDARRGNKNVSLSISGWVNRMLLAWDDGASKDVYIVDNTSSRSRLEFEGAVKIARGWGAGYILSFGMDDKAANDVDQLDQSGESQIELRESAWWVRSNDLGTVTVGHTSPATDNIILKDVGGIMPGAANIATMGGGFYLRGADTYEQGPNGLITGTLSTTLNDISGGASVDTLRRDVVRYDAPRVSSQWGNVDLAAAWGEDDFYDFAGEYGINYNDWKFRFGAGYLRDTTESTGRTNTKRDREEYKGSASLIHVPSGLFATAAYVRREFNGFDASSQAVFGENTQGLVTPRGSNRPPLEYLYTAFGVRRPYWSIGDTSIYGEYAEVDDAITGLREASLREVTDSELTMFGAAISQDIDAASMDVYAGFRYYTFDTEGVQFRTATGVTGQSPAPLTDLVLGYAGTRIKF